MSYTGRRPPEDLCSTGHRIPLTSPKSHRKILFAFRDSCMINANHRLFRGPFQTPLVVLPLLALLLVFLSSVTHQQASAARVGHGFVGPLDHLVVASHTESLWAQCGNVRNDAADDGPDLPDVGCKSRSVLSTGLCCHTPASSAVAVYPSATPRFLIPLLRAPPLA